MRYGPLVSSVVLVGILLAGALPGPCLAGDPSGELLRERVMVLTSPTLAGRGSGTLEADAAADTLAAWMAALHLKPAFGGSWFQDVQLSGTGWSGEDLTGKIGRNVAGILPGSGSLAGRYLVVGAHYDHLGRLDPQEGAAPPPAAGEYYPGANDNASGVSLVMELIRLAIDDPGTAADRRSLLFASFVAEEVGLQGSGFMVSNLPVVADSIDAMINIDTVGQLTDNRLHVGGVGTTPVFETLVAAANTGDLDLSLSRGGWSGSDHMSFNTREIPVLFVFGGAYPQYNRPADDWATLDFAALTRVAGFTDRLVRLLQTEPGDWVWVMVAEKTLRPSEGEDQNRATWFGSLPDFTEAVPGYKLAGVFDGSPAARAGLEKGDVLVLFGGAPVEDLASFTRALRSHAPGDLVEVRVERQGRLMNFTVVLGDRADRQ